eukprot:6337238-Pyramimonas_sp.AAC.1
MKNALGPDCEQWPKIGCESKSSPFKSGPPMVAELNVEAAWQALIAERLLRQLDDAIEECRGVFFDAAEKISPEELFDVIPLSSPMTREIGGRDFVTRCPVDPWEGQGKQAFTAQSRCEEALQIAENDEDHLQEVMKVAM